MRILWRFEMRRARRLKTLGKALGERLDHLQLLLTPYAGRLDAEASRMASFVLVNCVAGWGLFAREYFFSCALLSPELKNGDRVRYSSPLIADEREALIEAIRAAKNPQFSPAAGVNLKPRDEPDWLAKDTLSKISTRLGFSHDIRLANALAYQTSFFPEAVTVRNFYAHRGKESADKIRNLARRTYYKPRLGHPTEFVNTILPRRTDTLINEWIADLRIISGSLCS
jgi:hypothetical protein